MIPPVKHLAGRAHPQSIKRNFNALYYRQLHEFGRMTGAAAVMNSPFNLRGEAIVPVLTDALYTFFGAYMNATVIGNCIVAT